jgi:hypothetical protein
LSTHIRLRGDKTFFFSSIQKKKAKPISVYFRNLSKKWYVLACGHSFCKDCTNVLSNSDNLANQPGSTNSRNNLVILRNIRCALCRELSIPEKTYLVCTNRQTQKPDNNQPQDPCNKSANMICQSYQESEKFDDIKIRVFFFFHCLFRTFI